MSGTRGDLPFVGRARELTVLLERLTRAGVREGGVVLIGGEPGIGKTRLLLEFAGRARQAGCLVLSGRAYEAEGMPPYLPLVEALREYSLTAPVEELHGVLGRGAPELARLVPELGDALPEVSPPASLSPEHDRYRLFESVTHTLLAIARATSGPGLVLLLDDLHWADAPTLLLLHHLARKLPDSPLLIAGAHRNAAADIGRSFTDLLAELSRQGLAEYLTLAPLSLEDAAAVIAGITGVDPAPAVAEALHRAAEGNPFLLGELVRHWQAEGRNLADERTLLTSRGAPEGVRRVLESRLARLRPETRRALQAAAVLGERVDVAVLTAMGLLDEETLAEALEEAVGAGMIREEPDGQQYAFAHALIQERLYTSLNLVRRQRLHRRAGEAIERLYARSLAAQSPALAAHYRLAGAGADPQKAIEYTLRAADAARAVFAFEEAERYWQIALELMEQHGAEPERQAEILEQLGDLLQETGFGNYARSIECFERAIRLYEHLGDGERAARVHSRLGLVLGAGSVVMDIERAVRSFRTALTALPDGSENVTTMNAYAGLGLIGVWQVRPEEGLADSRRAMAIAEHLGEPRWINAAVMAGYHLISSGRPAEGLDLMARAWQEAARVNQTFRGNVAATWLGNHYLALLAPVEAAAWFQRELAQSREMLVPMRRRVLEGQLAAALAMQGDLPAAVEMVRAPGEAPEAALRQPFVALYSGTWDQAESVWRQQREFHLRRGGRSMQAFADRWLARVRALRGDTREAILLLEGALSIGQDGPELFLELSVAPELALLYSADGQIERAASLVKACRRILAAGEDWRGLAGRVALADAAVAAAEGRADDADARYAEAIDIFRRCSLPWDEAEALIAWGGAATQSVHGRPAGRAAVLLDSALALYRRIGAGQPWLDRLLAEKERLSLDGGPRTESYPDDLTEREVGVLRLLAAGKSNREIGAELVLSVRTVERHIMNVYAKTGTHTRTRATLYAQEHRLA